MPICLFPGPLVALVMGLLLYTVAVVVGLISARACFRNALSVARDFAGAAFQGADTVGFAAKDNEQIPVGISWRGRQLGVFRELVERGLCLRAAPLVVDIA